jgi:hypothetical protein
MSFVLAHPIGGRGRDASGEDEEFWTAGFRRACGIQRLLKCIEVIGNIAKSSHFPSVGTKAHVNVIGTCEIRGSIDRDSVVIEDCYQPVQTLMAGEGSCLVADAFHHAAIAEYDESAMVADVGTESRSKVALRERQADGIGETLAQRTRRHFDARGVEVFGMTGSCRTPLAESLNVGELEPVTLQEEQRILENRSMSGRENESIAIRPQRIIGIVSHDPRIEDVPEGSQ